MTDPAEVGLVAADLLVAGPAEVDLAEEGPVAAGLAEEDRMANRQHGSEDLRPAAE